MVSRIHQVSSPIWYQYHQGFIAIQYWQFFVHLASSEYKFWQFSEKLYFSVRTAQEYSRMLWYTKALKYPKMFQFDLCGPISTNAKWAFKPGLNKTCFENKCNRAQCTVSIKARRGQLWKGKQHKILDKKNERKQQWCQTFWNYKIATAFSYGKKMTSFRSLSHLMLWNKCRTFVYLFSGAHEAWARSVNEDN